MTYLHTANAADAADAADPLGLGLDLDEVIATDILIDDVLAGLDTHEPLGRALAAWREQVNAAPMPELIDVDTALGLIARGRRERGGVGWARYLTTAAVAAGVALAAIAGAASSAKPGEALWPVSRVLYASHAASVEAAARVEQRIARAKEALAAGRSDLAAAELTAAAVELIRVAPEDGHAQLAAANSFLAVKADETPIGVPVDPAAPLRTDPSRPVPLGCVLGMAVIPIAAALPLPPPPPAVLPTPSPAVSVETGGGGAAASSAVSSTVDAPVQEATAAVDETISSAPLDDVPRVLESTAQVPSTVVADAVPTVGDIVDSAVDSATGDSESTPESTEDSTVSSTAEPTAEPTTEPTEASEEPTLDPGATVERVVPDLGGALGGSGRDSSDQGSDAGGK